MLNFLKMGAYGLYIWSAFGLVALSMMYSTWRASKQYNQLLQDLKRHASDS